MKNPEKYTDKYFLRTRKILQEEGINPVVRMQVFSRTDVNELHGINEALEIIADHSDLEANGGKVWALPEGSEYKAGEAMMVIEAPVQDIVHLETLYLGVISAAMTNDLERNIDLKEVENKAKQIVEAAQGKPVLYFGARHFHWNLDEKIAETCKNAGFVGTSTDAGAKYWDAEGIGTVPHALILSYAAAREGNPTVNAMLGFDKHIDDEVKRVALIDTYNKEVDDTLATAEALEGRLAGIRIDTCGENVTQYSERYVDEVRSLVPETKYREGNGVTVTGVWTLRRELDKAGYGDVSLTVSSGFNEIKTAAFIEADKIYQEQYGKPLFDAIGSGSIAKPVMATADIVQYQTPEGEWVENSKVGRGYKANDKLELALGGK